MRCADDFVLLGCEPKFFKNLVPSTTSKDQRVTNTHTLSLFFFFFFFFLYVYNVKSTICKTLFFTIPFCVYVPTMDWWKTSSNPPRNPFNVMSKKLTVTLHYIGDSIPTWCTLYCVSEQIWMTVCKDSNARFWWGHKERERERLRETKDQKKSEQRIGNFEGEEIW